MLEHIHPAMKCFANFQVSDSIRMLSRASHRKRAKHNNAAEGKHHSWTFINNYYAQRNRGAEFCLKFVLYQKLVSENIISERLLIVVPSVNGELCYSIRNMEFWSNGMALENKLYLQWIVQEDKNMFTVFINRCCVLTQIISKKIWTFSLGDSLEFFYERSLNYIVIM